jgi:hypothetical protein
LLTEIRARASARALASGLMLGSGIGLVLGGAYWMGERAQLDASHARAARLADAAAHSFSVSALRGEIQAMGPGALYLAQRHDPFPGALATLRGGPGPDSAARFSAQESASDLACLTDAVYYEARGETVAGQAAVAQVVLNRVRHPAFPKSVCGVVFQRAEAGEGCQFSFVCDGSMRREREPNAWRRAQEIAERALEGSVMSTVGKATHFHVVGLDPGWGPSLARVAQVGLHVFYRFTRVHPAAEPSAEPQPAGLAEDPSLASADGAPTGHYILASTTTSLPAAGLALSAQSAAGAMPDGGSEKAITEAKAQSPDASQPASRPISGS